MQVVNNHKTKDTCVHLQSLIQMCPSYINLSVDHIRGSQKVEADLLSRIHSDKAIDQKFLMELKNNYIWNTVEPSHLKLDLFLQFQMLHNLQHIRFKGFGAELMQPTDLPPLLLNLLISEHSLHFYCFPNYLYRFMSIVF